MIAGYVLLLLLLLLLQGYYDYDSNTDRSSAAMSTLPGGGPASMVDLINRVKFLRNISITNRAHVNELNTDTYNNYNQWRI